MNKITITQIDRRLSDASLKSLSLSREDPQAVMNRLADLEIVADSYNINMAACREANDMLIKENKELRAKLAAISPLRDQVAGIGRADYPPTQAQIEAAAKVLNVSYENKAYARKMAKAVLTAVAGVPDQEHILQKPGQKPGLLPGGNIAAEAEVQNLREDYKNMTASRDRLWHQKREIEAASAAKEVEQLDTFDQLTTEQAKWYLARIAEVKAATIERCAQMIDERWPHLRMVSDAIRAMKEKP